MSEGVIVLIPAYQAERPLPAVVRQALEHLPVLVVDDGSTDDTGRVAEATGATVLRQTPNQGKGVALKKGFRHALDEGYDAVLTLDADGQHDPAEIPKFLDEYERGRPDLIVGARDFDQMPPVRRLANNLGRWTLSWAAGEPVRDNQSGYRLINRRVMEATLESVEAGFEFEVEMTVLVMRRRWDVRWVPIRTIYTGEGSHIDPVHHVIHYLRMVWQTRRSRMKET